MSDGSALRCGRVVVAPSRSLQRLGVNSDSIHFSPTRVTRSGLGKIYTVTNFPVTVSPSVSRSMLRALPLRGFAASRETILQISMRARPHENGSHAKPLSRKVPQFPPFKPPDEAAAPGSARPPCRRNRSTSRSRTRRLRAPLPASPRRTCSPEAPVSGRMAIS
jgi:hypothetical protein